MKSPCMNPMIHAVYALTVIDEKTGLGESPKRTTLMSPSQYGDIRNVTCPKTGKTLQIPLDQELSINFVIPNCEVRSPASRIWGRYIEPAAREMAEQVLAPITAGYRCFARMELPPEDLGVKCFRADHNDLSVMCTMSYNIKKRGVEVQLDMLYGCLDINDV